MLDDYLGVPNSPADNYWTLVFQFTRQNETISRNASITFSSSTGRIAFDRTLGSDLGIISTLLAPSTTILENYAATRGITVDVTRYMSWLIVSYYWTILASLGQVAPINYPPLRFAALPDFRVDFTQPTSYSETNNPFVNQTVFENYSSFLQETILPLLNYSSPTLAELNDMNRL